MVFRYPVFPFREALCPVDMEESGLLVDDELNEILVQPLPAGVLGSLGFFSLMAVSTRALDSHSSALDLYRSSHEVCCWYFLFSGIPHQQVMNVPFFDATKNSSHLECFVSLIIQVPPVSKKISKALFQKNRSHFDR